VKKNILSKEDVLLWDKIVTQTKPLEKQLKDYKQLPRKGAAKNSVSAGVNRIGSVVESNSETKPFLELTPKQVEPFNNIKMDRKKYYKIKKGKESPEDILDLHGFTVDQAFVRLEKFINKAVKRDLRLVLIITGKGLSRINQGFSTPKVGVLKASFINWLDDQKINKFVLQSMPAHRTHGGGGAYYIYLKRKVRV